MLGPMWLDQRGSEVLPRSECLRLLAAGAAAGALGRLAAVAEPDSAPLVRPVNFGFEDGRVLLRLGPGAMAELVGGRLVAFETDGIEAGPERDDRRPFGWSVLVRGLGLLVPEESLAAAASRHLPQPLVPVPGELLFTVRPDVVSGRRFLLRDADAALLVRR